MKKSKINWVEYIPKNWEEKPLKSLLLESKEKNTNIKTKNILSVTKDRGVIPYEEKGQIGNNKSEDIGRYKLVKKNDLVVNKMNIVIGSLGISRYSGALSQVYLVYRPKVELDIRYYEYVFRNPKFYKYTKKYTTGIMELRESLNDLYFKNTYLPVPPMKEQIKIANFLDEKINRIDKIIKIKQKNLNKIISYNEKKIEKILNSANNYTIKKLKYLGNLQNGVSKNQEYFVGSKKFVNYSNVKKNHEIDWLEVNNFCNANEDDLKKYCLKKGDLLITRTSETIKDSFITSRAKQDIMCTYSGFLIRYRLYNEVYSKYMMYMLNSNGVRNKFQKDLNVVTRVSVSQDKIKDIEIKVPPKEELQKIIEECDTLVEKTNKLSKNLLLEIKLLDEYKKVLINDAVTGKIDIGDEYGK